MYFPAAAIALKSLKTKDLYYKTFYLLNLWIFILGQSVYPLHVFTA